MSIIVKQLDPARRAHRARFINLDRRIYDGDPMWVQPLRADMHGLLNPKAHPFHEHAEVALFLAERDGRPVGRVTAHANHRHDERWADGAGFFGFFECMNDPEVAGELFGAAAGFLKERGYRRIRGPFSWSPNEEVGLLVDGFDSPPVIMMPYGKPYYGNLLERAGLSKRKDLVAYEIRNAADIPDRLARGVEIIKKRHDVSVRSLDMSRFSEEVELAQWVYNEAWEDNWGSVPMTQAEFRHLARDLKRIVEPVLVLFAYVGDELAGFSLAVPDANQAIRRANGRLFPFGIIRMLREFRRIHSVRVLALGVLDPYRNRGIDIAMYYQTFKNGLEKGYHSGEFSWILEDNYTMRNALEKFGARAYKTYRIYEREL
ncbi:MAG: hypothetical protein ACLFRR_10200 [Spirochaetaceae bacterium]